MHDAAAGRLRLYVDGRLAAVARPGPRATLRDRSPWAVALRGGPRPGWFSGGIDEVRVWGRALTDADISVLV